MLLLKRIIKKVLVLLHIRDLGQDLALVRVLHDLGLVHFLIQEVVLLEEAGLQEKVGLLERGAQLQNPKQFVLKN